MNVNSFGMNPQLAEVSDWYTPKLMLGGTAGDRNKYSVQKRCPRELKFAYLTCSRSLEGNKV